MPFQSQAQARLMFATKPAMAKEFAEATPSIKALPQYVAKSAKKRTKKQNPFQGITKEQ